MNVRRRTRRQRIENCCDLTNERTNKTLLITYEIIKLDSIASNKHINETYCVMCVNVLHPQCNRNARQVTNKVTYFDCKRLQDNVCSKSFSFLHSMAILWRFFYGKFCRQPNKNPILYSFRLLVQRCIYIFGISLNSQAQFGCCLWQADFTQITWRFNVYGRRKKSFKNGRTKPLTQNNES